MSVQDECLDSLPPPAYSRSSSLYRGTPGTHFSKVPETFRDRKENFSSSVSKNGEIYTPKNSCLKRTFVHISNTWIQQLCNRKARNFALAFRARNVSRAFEKPAPEVRFLKAPERFRARKAIFKSSVSENGEVYTPETSCMKVTSLDL